VFSIIKKIMAKKILARPMGHWRKH